MAAITHSSLQPLIMIIGATGTEKLAVELAKCFNGEIVNGDAMQMYQGLPIITNKIPLAERDGIPHHLLDCVPLSQAAWTVNQFVSNSTRIIDEIRSRGKLPIVVGGTHYYTHALLFRDAILQQSEGAGVGQEADGITQNGVLDKSILEAPTDQIYKKLEEVDPVMARRWHPNDRRKIQRSLEIWLRTGRKASDVYAEQQESKSRQSNDSENTHGAAILRYSPLLLWLEAEDHVLKQRLDARVDAMVKDGLLQEVSTLRDLENDMKAEGKKTDKSKGIWVSIGYKELTPWLEASATNKSADQKDVLTGCLNAVKASTRRYAKRQNRYIRIRLANDLKEAAILDRLFVFDTSRLEEWSTRVAEPVQSLVHSFLQNRPLPAPPELSPLAGQLLGPLMSGTDKHPNRQAKYCETCDKTLMTEKEWQGHLASRGHKKVAVSQRRHIAQAAGGVLDPLTNDGRQTSFPHLAENVDEQRPP